MYIYTQKPTGLFTVYLITNKTNNKRYIGIHKEKPNEDLYAYMGSGTAITEAIDTEGVDNFTKVILARFDTREEMVEMEKQLVTEDIANSEEYYNRMTGGNHPILSEETKQKQSLAMKGKYVGENNPRYGSKHSKETKQKIREAGLGRKHSEETLQKIAASWTEERRANRRAAMSGENNPNFGRTGEKNHMFGKKHSKETKQKISKTMKGKYAGENHPMYRKTGENHPMYGKKHSEASLEMMREKKRGENNPRAKLANIYCYKTDRLIAEAVVIKVWCCENDGYGQGALSNTARADRTQPSTTRNPHHHKGIYARYI